MRRRRFRRGTNWNAGVNAAGAGPTGDRLDVTAVALGGAGTVGILASVSDLTVNTDVGGENHTVVRIVGDLYPFFIRTAVGAARGDLFVREAIFLVERDNAGNVTPRDLFLGADIGSEDILYMRQQYKGLPHVVAPLTAPNTEHQWFHDIYFSRWDVKVKRKMTNDTELVYSCQWKSAAANEILTLAGYLRVLHAHAR